MLNTRLAGEQAGFLITPTSEEAPIQTLEDLEVTDPETAPRPSSRLYWWLTLWFVIAAAFAISAVMDMNGMTTPSAFARQRPVQFHMAVILAGVWVGFLLVLAARRNLSKVLVALVFAILTVHLTASETWATAHDPIDRIEHSIHRWYDQHFDRHQYIRGGF